MTALAALAFPTLAFPVLTVGAGLVAPAPVLAQVGGATAGSPNGSPRGSGQVESRQELVIAWLGQRHERPPTLSNVPPPPEDEGLQGARLGLADTATTGKFLKQFYRLEEFTLEPGQDPAELLDQITAQGIRFVVSGLDAPTLDRVLSLPNAGALTFFNALAPDDRLRDGDCRANLFHTLPSRAMRADALAQTLIQKRWREWLVVQGPTQADALFAAAIERAAARFGAKVVAKKVWTGEGDLRRSAQTELVAFTQGEDYDVVIVADEANDFGDYLPYNTALPRPVVGTQGLTPEAWHWSLENWGAGQLQNRFVEQAGRPMRSADWAGWVAIRALGEAATQSRSMDPDVLQGALKSESFRVAGFKGRPLSFRSWNHQLRQPILMVWPRALIAVAPFEGFLHPENDLDTLGMDRPESSCQF